ncbi:DNA alkylation repair protein [Paenibacillus sinopodophylli]|uniref:DNA alkylation repair protein n=1 Tax=Paenibacillus sinopodophylli TaxID=1837342 RepID=UPI00110D0F3F|nr:DNA alkylation repair protein [Paenibacillus sinopodophylli]
MAEPLKAMYDGFFLERFAALVKTAWSPFDESRFVEHVRDGDWEQLELKARCRKITEALGTALPESYGDALAVLYQIDEKCTGLPYIFFSDFVEQYGMEPHNWELSLAAMMRFTERSTAEFAIRSFILHDPERMASVMLAWAEHPNEHVRRLASEGIRPRLPWAQALPQFKHDPSPIVPILERLKCDPSLYVRKSVANNLNDIAKDHPELVISLAEAWRGKDERTDWIVRHGCRTLIKQSVPEIMALFGYAKHGGAEERNQPLVADASIIAAPSVIAIGGEVALSYHVRLREGDTAKLRIEYGIAFVKSSGKTSLKRFLLSDREYAGGAEAYSVRVHRFADLTTRKHYSGLHLVTLWVNGREVARAELAVTEAALS